MNRLPHVERIVSPALSLMIDIKGAEVGSRLILSGTKPMPRGRYHWSPSIHIHRAGSAVHIY